MAVLTTRTWSVKNSAGELDKVYLNEDHPDHRPLTPSNHKEGYFLKSSQQRVEPVSDTEFRATDGRIYTLVDA
jgi:hypothetical protein